MLVDFGFTNNGLHSTDLLRNMNIFSLEGTEVFFFGCQGYIKMDFLFSFSMLQ